MSILVGKRGPLAIQYLPALDSNNDTVEAPYGIFIDEAVNHPAMPDGTPTTSPALHGALAADALAATGDAAAPLTSIPNLTQQSYLLSATTQALIPRLKQSGKPFAMLYWSRDPDTTQHGALDSEGSLTPGINATSDRTAIYNADSNLKGILDALKQYGLDGNTDILVIADHGFSPVAKGIPAADGTVPNISLPGGFLTIDIAKWLGAKIYDPDQSYAELDPAGGEHPKSGNALIGPSTDAPQVQVVNNGTTEFLYLPEGAGRLETARTLVAKLAEAPYTGGLFVNDALLKQGKPADFAGALPMSEIGLIGSSKIPQPSIVVTFRTFQIKGCKLTALLCTAEVSDTGLHTGQGNHGSFSRADTRNFMAAIGPDFKAKTKIATPVGNMDVAPTAAHLLGLTLEGPGTLKGRVIAEALKGGAAPKVTKRRIASPKAPNGVQTVVEEQEVDGVRYFDAGGIPGRTVGLTGK